MGAKFIASMLRSDAGFAVWIGLLGAAAVAGCAALALLGPGLEAGGWGAFMLLFGILPALYLNVATGYLLARLGRRNIVSPARAYMLSAFIDPRFISAVWTFEPESKTERRMQVTFILSHAMLGIALVVWISLLLVGAVA